MVCCCRELVRYVLSHLDEAGRYKLLEPIASKSSCEVADHIICKTNKINIIIFDIFISLNIFWSRFGPPKRCRCDNGTEFKGLFIYVYIYLYY